MFVHTCVHFLVYVIVYISVFVSVLVCVLAYFSVYVRVDVFVYGFVSVSRFVHLVYVIPQQRLRFGVPISYKGGCVQFWPEIRPA